MDRKKLTEERENLRDSSRLFRNVAALYIGFTLLEVGVSEFNIKAKIIMIGGAVLTSALGTVHAIKSVELSNQAESINTVLIQDSFVNSNS